MQEQPTAAAAAAAARNGQRKTKGSYERLPARRSATLRHNQRARHAARRASRPARRDGARKTYLCGNAYTDRSFIPRSTCGVRDHCPTTIVVKRCSNRVCDSKNTAFEDPLRTREPPREVERSIRAQCDTRRLAADTGLLDHCAPPASATEAAPKKGEKIRTRQRRRGGYFRSRRPAEQKQCYGRGRRRRRRGAPATGAYLCSNCSADRGL